MDRWYYSTSSTSSGEGRAVLKWACLTSVAILVGCGDAPQPQAARTNAAAPRAESAVPPPPTKWVLLDPEEIPRRPEELDVHLLSLNGEPRLQYRVRVVPDDPFPIQDYWRWEQLERLDWRFEPLDR